MDGSRAAEPALLHARDLAHDQGATLYLIQAVPHNVELEQFQGAVGMQQLKDFNVDMAHQIERQRVTQAHHYLETNRKHLEEEGVHAIIAVLRGGASQQIVQYARDNDIDLIVMTTRGHSGIHLILVGSITQQVIRSAPVPVLVVPSQIETAQ